MLLTEYDEQRHIASEKEASREEGMKDGLEMGLKEGLKAGLRKAAINLFKRGMSIEEAAIICEEEAGRVRKLYEEWKCSINISKDSPIL